MGKKWTINDWNAKIDRTLTRRVIGKQGIQYEFILPYGANPTKYYEEALDVRSIKRSEQYNNGYRLGQYQPVGDKRYFIYYQKNKMSEEDRQIFALQDEICRIAREYFGIYD